MLPIARLSYMERLPVGVRMFYPFELYGKGGAEQALLARTVNPTLSEATLVKDLKEVCVREGEGHHE